MPGWRSHNSRMVVTAVGAQRLAAATGDATWPASDRGARQSDALEVDVSSRGERQLSFAGVHIELLLGRAGITGNHSSPRLLTQICCGSKAEGCKERLAGNNGCTLVVLPLQTMPDVASGHAGRPAAGTQLRLQHQECKTANPMQVNLPSIWI